jgi:hypothetical protein
MKSEVYKIKVDMRDELLARILEAAAQAKKREDNSVKQHAVFPHELQSASRFKVGFSNIYCDL